MTPERAVHCVKTALAEAGYPDAGVQWRFGRVSCSVKVPPEVAYRVGELLAHTRGVEWPDFDEWRAWSVDFDAPRPWWGLTADEAAEVQP